MAHTQKIHLAVDGVPNNAAQMVKMDFKNALTIHCTNSHVGSCAFHVTLVNGAVFGATLIHCESEQKYEIRSRGSTRSRIALFIVRNEFSVTRRRRAR